MLGVSLKVWFVDGADVRSLESRLEFPPPDQIALRVIKWLLGNGSLTI